MTDAAQQTSESRPQLGGPNEVMIFIRSDGFYPIQGVRGIDLRQQAQDHAALNPGTLRVEDTKGNVLWSLQ